MLRFTFIVGGGKLIRARYDEELPKWTVGALKAIGFSEDRSAAETFDSQGTFKQQHDTGQNAKVVIVYPRVSCASSSSVGAGGGKAEGGEMVNTKSPEYIACAADLDSFKQKVALKISSWRQCKRLLKVLQENNEKIKAIEAKLCTGAPLTPQEQAVYDGNSGVAEEKIAWLQGELKGYVTENRLTASEKQELLTSLQANLVTVEEKIAEAMSQDKPKKAEKLAEMKKEVLDRKAAAERLNPIQLRLRLGDEVQRLRVMLLPLIELEKKGRSMSLTMDDLHTLRDKPDIEEDIAKLEAASRGWFEDEDDFQARCAYEAVKAKAKFEGSSKKKAAGATSSKGGNTSGWATVSTVNGPGGSKKGSAWGGAAANKKTANGFSALSLDD